MKLPDFGIRGIRAGPRYPRSQRTMRTTIMSSSTKFLLSADADLRVWATSAVGEFLRLFPIRTQARPMSGTRLGGGHEADQESYSGWTVAAEVYMLRTPAANQRCPPRSAMSRMAGTLTNTVLWNRSPHDSGVTSRYSCIVSSP